MSTLFVPLSLAAFGIVLRGAAFAFRPVAAGLPARRAAGAVFAASSVVTPFFLGTAAGAIAGGRVTVGDGPPDLFGSVAQPDIDPRRGARGRDLCLPGGGLPRRRCAAAPRRRPGGVLPAPRDAGRGGGRCAVDGRDRRALDGRADDRRPVVGRRAAVRRRRGRARDDRADPAPPGIAPGHAGARRRSRRRDRLGLGRRPVPRDPARFAVTGRGRGAARFAGGAARRSSSSRRSSSRRPSASSTPSTSAAGSRATGWAGNRRRRGSTDARGPGDGHATLGHRSRT